MMDGRFGEFAGDWNDLPPLLGRALEDRLHRPFEAEAAVERDIGLLDVGDVAGRWLVEMGIDASRHQRLNGPMLSGDVPGEFRDHASGGDDLQSAGRRGRWRPHLRARSAPYPDAEG